MAWSAECDFDSGLPFAIFLWSLEKLSSRLLHTSEYLRLTKDCRKGEWVIEFLMLICELIL